MLPGGGNCSWGSARGVVLIMRERPDAWSVELARFYGPNMVS